MAPPRDYRVLIPIDVLGGESVPRTIVDAFASVPVVLLGYREIPDQTGTDQARDQYAPRMRSELDDVQRTFEDAGCLDVSTRLVFTHDRLETFERVAVETDCDGVLLVNPAPVLESVLVAIRSDVNLEYIAQLLAALVADTDLEVTFFHVVSDEDDRDRGTELLDDATEELIEHGIDRDRVDTVLSVDGSPTREILDVASEYDLLVVGESRPSIRRFIFRDRAKKLARKTVDPVLVIRGEYLEVEDGDESTDPEDGGGDS
ncbi:universal stress protein [Natrarchaeobius chitinivorans]|uniref:Universal stress protein n=1 Tax=Natrarchaeobius chitinivorans TaxID=1679083 RepID=A0A3N6M029_NATCH|nr:universal stress protein [Natrarchaeobius chitinivorans]RQG96568.1 universal stress protein [Natrarchaeobius chitinivorans]